MLDNGPVTGLRPFLKTEETLLWAQKANYPTFYLGIILSTWTSELSLCLHKGTGLHQTEGLPY